MVVHKIKDKEEFDCKLSEAEDKLVVVDFFATWCGPCKVISPKIEVLSEEHVNVVFLKVDVDECDDIAQEYNISAMPTFVFIKKKEKVDEFAGANETKLIDCIQKHK